MDGMKKTDGLGMPCDPERKRDEFGDMKQMAKILSRSSTRYLGQPELFREDNLDAQIKGVLASLRDNAQDLFALIGKRDAA